MEMLDALERKVIELLNEIAALRAHNSELEAAMAGSKKAAEDGREKIGRLEEALKQEQKLHADILQRISTLVRQLEGMDSAG